MTAQPTSSQAADNTNLEQLAQTLLRIVARLPKTEYSGLKSNGHSRRRAEVVEHSDPADPASAGGTSQG
ncbi:MAG: hypothetical protein H6672_18005 [Anaerolineaceae bacterium]|nr:hypothetical protein [Anaerolineaceae bacterium]